MVLRTVPSHSAIVLSKFSINITVISIEREIQVAGLCPQLPESNNVQESIF